MKLIKLTPYPFDLIYLHCTKDEVIKWVSKKIPQMVIDEPEIYNFDNCKWRTICTKEWWIIIWIDNNYNDVWFISHEAFHAVEYLFNNIGLPHSETSSEAWSYMLQYIVTQLYECKTTPTSNKKVRRKKRNR